MNPGYLSFLLLCITMILLACGWKKQLAGDVSHHAVFLFIISWLICSALNVQLTEMHRVNLCYLLLIVVIVWIGYGMETWMDTFHFISVGLLIGAAYILLNQLVQMEPIFILAHPYVNISLILTIIAALFIRQPMQQIAAITIGLMAGDLIYSLLKHNHLPFALGTPTLYDQWWLLFLATRLLSEIIENVWKGFKLMLQFWLKD